MIWQALAWWAALTALTVAVVTPPALLCVVALAASDGDPVWGLGGLAIGACITAHAARRSGP
jgi:hypothetical protein